jgi:hypothetical protein
MLTLLSITALSAKNTENPKSALGVVVPPVVLLELFSEFAAAVVSFLPSGSSSLEELDLQAR